MSINERLVAWLRRLAQTDRTTLDLLLAAVLIGIIGAVVFGMPAHGQTPCPSAPTCEPGTTKDRTVCGPELKGRTAAGEWWAFWWLDASAAPPRWCGYSFAVLDQYRLSPAALVAAVQAVRASSEPFAVAAAKAIAAGSITPAAGGAEEYELRMLRHGACQALAAAPMPGQTATCSMAVPVPPAAPVGQYVVTSVTLYPVTAAGTRGPALASPRAAIGQACDCATRSIANPYGGRYCAVTVQGASGPVVAGCSLKR